MFVSEKYRVDQRDFFSQQLHPQFGRGVDQQRPARQKDSDRTTGAVVPGIVALANRAGTSDRRHADAGSGAQEYDGGRGVSHERGSGRLVTSRALEGSGKSKLRRETRLANEAPFCDTSASSQRMLPNHRVLKAFRRVERCPKTTRHSKI
jgi:hypothetical protein